MAERVWCPQAGRSIFRLWLLLLAMFGLAGCQIIPQVDPRPTPPPVSQERQAPRQPQAAPPPTTPPHDQPAAVPRLPEEDRRQRVAVLVPITGANGGLGLSIANAANLALADTGAERIRLTVYDTAPGARAAAEQALREGNGLILGPLLAEDARVVGPIARRAGVPVVSFSNDVAVAGNGVFIIGYNPSQSIDRVVDYARSRGAQRFGALVPAGLYGQRASRAMIRAVEGAGGRMIGMQTYDRSRTGLADAARRLDEQGDYDAVLIADGTRIAAQAAPLVRRGSAEAQILGTELWAAESDIGEIAALRGAWFAAVPDERFDQFRARYRARYGTSPYRLSSLGYDATLMALRIAADWPEGQRFPADALRDPGGFIGLDGIFRFGRGHVAERGLAVHEVTGEGAAIVSPAPEGFD